MSSFLTQAVPVDAASYRSVAGGSIPLVAGRHPRAMRAGRSRKTLKIATFLSVISWFGMLLPPGMATRVRADQPGNAIRDAALDPSGMMTGRVTDANGVPCPGRPVALLQGATFLTTATTDGEGRFAFAGLRGGVYGLASGNDLQLVRAWVAGTAPPHATGVVSLVAGTGVERGQGPVGIGLVPLACLGMSVTALALAIILPITLSNNDDPEAS